MSAVRETVFATHDGMMQFYAIGGGTFPDDRAFQEMVARASQEWPALLSINGPVSVVKQTVEGMRETLRAYERGGVRLESALGQAVGADTLDEGAMLSLAIAFEASSRLWGGGDIRLEGDAFTLADGRRIGIVPLWSGRLANGEEGRLYSLAVLPGELRTQEVPPRPAPPPAGPICNECPARALYACSRCGAFCCEAHLERSSVWRHYGAVCTRCASAGCVWLVVNLSIVSLVVIIGVIVMALSKAR
ncbi:MAG: hypothetical protein K2W96_27890 [Gemmataceae bacterium]|nr:hypothetical protein [Gemmataceae bacterium]